MTSIFSFAYWLSVCLLLIKVYLGLVHTFQLDFIFFFFGILVFELYELFVYFGNWALIGHIFCKYFLPVHRLSFHSAYGSLCCAKAYKFDEVQFVYFCFCIFFSFLLIYFNWRIIALQCCYGFCHISTWIGQGCTCPPHLEPPSQLPPYPSPLGCYRAPALGTLLQYIELSLVIYFTYGNVYICQCYSLKLSHPILPLNPKSVLYICVSFAALYLGLLVPSI